MLSSPACRSLRHAVGETIFLRHFPASRLLQSGQGAVGMDPLAGERRDSYGTPSKKCTGVKEKADVRDEPCRCSNGLLPRA